MTVSAHTQTAVPDEPERRPADGAVPPVDDAQESIAASGGAATGRAEDAGRGGRGVSLRAGR